MVTANPPTIFETDALEGPDTRATSSAHRKIELQSPADLAYLIANVSRAARAKIDTHLPPDAAPESGEDALRQRVESLVEEYIRRTFEGVKEGVSVNGMGVGEMEEVLGRVGEGEGEFLLAMISFTAVLRRSWIVGGVGSGFLLFFFFFHACMHLCSLC